MMKSFFVLVLFCIKSASAGCSLLLLLLKLALLLNTLESNTVYILNAYTSLFVFFFSLHFQHDTNVKTSEKNRALLFAPLGDLLGKILFTKKTPQKDFK